MTAIRLTLERDEQRAADYILARVKALKNTTAKVSHHKKFITIDLSSAKDLFAAVKDIISSVILIFYKYDYLKENLASLNIEGMPCHALMGALLSFDEIQEKIIIEKGLEKRSVYSIKSIYEFRCGKLKESWKNIATLADRLVSQCDDEEDIYDIIFFLIAIDTELSPRVRITLGEDGEVFLYSDTIRVPISRLSGDPQADILIAAIRERPSSIVISDSDIISKEVLEAIKKLGSGF